MNFLPIFWKLPEERKAAIIALIETQKSAGSQVNLEKPIAQIEDDWLLARTVRPLSRFDPNSVTIRRFVMMYETYTAALGLPERQKIDSFITYLDGKLQERLLNTTSLNSDSWEDYKNSLIKFLEDHSRRNAVTARFQIKRAKQKVTETVFEFADRLQELSMIGYPASSELNNHVIKENVLKDALASGVRDDDIAIELMVMIETSTYDQLLQEAVKLESSISTRSGFHPNRAATAMTVGYSSETDYCPVPEIENYPGSGFSQNPCDLRSDSDDEYIREIIDMD